MEVRIGIPIRHVERLCARGKSASTRAQAKAADASLILHFVKGAFLHKKGADTLFLTKVLWLFFFFRPSIAPVPPAEAATHGERLMYTAPGSHRTKSTFGIGFHSAAWSQDQIPPGPNPPGPNPWDQPPKTESQHYRDPRRVASPPGTKHRTKQLRKV